MTEPRVVVALVTPFEESGAVDLSALRAHVEYLGSQGVDSVMPCGTTGEGPLLEPGEVVRVIEQAVAAAAGAVRVLAHVGRAGTRQTCTLARRAIDMGADAVVAVAPYYYALDEDAILHHYRAFADAARGAPAYAYNIPGHTGNDLLPPLVAKLADGGIRALKDSTKSFERHLEYLAVAGELATERTFEVFMGSDGMALRSMKAGSTGSVSALSNARPDLFVSLRDAFVEGRNEDASAIQDEIDGERREIDRGPRYVGLKQAVARALRTEGIAYPTASRGPLG